MPQENSDETNSVIYSTLKHPLRRKILRLLKEEELTYTQILNKLDLDTGHLNYYLESLGELVAKTSEGKYRLSDYDVAAVKLMEGVEEPDSDQTELQPHRFSKRKLVLITQVVCIIALILSGALLMGINNTETYIGSGRDGSLDSKDLRVVPPNGTVELIDDVNVYSFPTDTLTTHYQTFYVIEIVSANVSLQIQVWETIRPMANIPEGTNNSDYFQDSTLIYNQTQIGPCGSLNTDGLILLGKVTYTIPVPIKSPQQRGLLVANSDSQYNLKAINLGTATLYRSNGDGKSATTITMTNNTGSFYLRVSYPQIVRTDYPYFYYGITLIILAVATAALPFLVVHGKWRKKKANPTS